MITLISAPGTDYSQFECINRLFDEGTNTVYIVQSLADYSNLPAAIIAMLGAQWYALQGMDVPANFLQE